MWDALVFQLQVQENVIEADKLCIDVSQFS